MTFGENFKAEREKRKLTQQEVADALGINRRMITRYENGISFPRTKGSYRKIADLKRCSMISRHKPLTRRMRWNASKPKVERSPRRIGSFSATGSFISSC